MRDELRFVEPEHFAAPRGYANGVLTQGPLLHVGGQIGWNAAQQFESEDFIKQFVQALDNVIDVVKAAGGQATDIASMTIYVTDVAAYRREAKALGPHWKERLGRHYPAMALVGVAALVEEKALVEIQATAVIVNAAQLKEES